MIVFGFGFGASSIDAQAIIKLPRDSAQILFAGWNSYIVRSNKGLIEIYGDFNPDEGSIVQDYCSKFILIEGQSAQVKNIKKRLPYFFGLESLQGYLSPSGDVVGLYKDTVSSLDVSTPVLRKPRVLYQRAKDVAVCGRSTNHSSVLIDEITGRLHQWNDLDPTPRDIINTIHVKFNKVWAGEAHMLALDCDGTLYSWGSGRHGQLGHGDLESISTPKPVESLQGIRIIGAACGSSFSVALSDTGDIYSFGLNDHGQLGIGTNRNETDKRNTLYPQLVDFFDEIQCIDVHVTKVTCGRSHTIVLDDSGQAWSCGWNKYGQSCQVDLPSSNGRQLDQYYFRKIQVQDSNPWKDVICGSWSTFLWKENDEENTQ